MKKRIPDYLKLHVEGRAPAGGETVGHEFAELCGAFLRATGCRLTLEPHPAAGGEQLTFPWLDGAATSVRAAVEPPAAGGDSSARLDEANDLASAVAEALTKLGHCREALRRREAELATAVPIVSVDDDEQHLAERLLAVLRGAAAMLHCSAAGLYLLDEGTTRLKLRAHYGLDVDAFTRPPRCLGDAIADIEAMAGHAVVVEDARLLSHWNIPAPCGSAVCVPVSTSTTILGTLWFFREVSQDFAPNEQNLAEMTAGRLAADLERHVLVQEVRQLRGQRRVDDQEGECEPSEPALRITPVIDDWDVAESSTSDRVGGSLCHWHLAADQRLHLSVGAAHDSRNPQRAALQLHALVAAHAQHDPRVAELFRQVNQSLWASSPEGEPASLFHAVLSPDCGVLHYGLVGGIHAYVLRPHGWEPLPAEQQLLGMDDEFHLQVRKQVLIPGDILLSIGSARAVRDFHVDNLMNSTAEKLLRYTHRPAAELAELAARTLRDEAAAELDLAVLIAKRNEG